MNGSLPHPELHNSETDPDSWSCSRSRDTSPESSIPPGMPSFRVIPLTCESEVGSSDPFCNNDAGPSYSGTLLRGSEPPEWETEPLQRAGSAQPPATLLRKNQYWVSGTLNFCLRVKICLTFHCQKALRFTANSVILQLKFTFTPKIPGQNITCTFK